MRRPAIAVLSIGVVLGILFVWRRRVSAEGVRVSYANLTRDELYERAKMLGIEGRSKMTKAELQRAVELADWGGSQGTAA